MSFISRLKDRWKVEKVSQVWIILLVFALTGFSVMYLKRWFKGFDFADYWWFDLVYYILILPVYNVLLLFYGAIFGQGKYFLNFEKRFFKRLAGWFGNSQQS